MIWTNWAGNQSFQASVAAPASEDEVVSAVRSALADGTGVRAAGAGHSFTPVIETRGTVLELSGSERRHAHRHRAAAGHGTAGHDRRSVRRSPLGGRAGACEPGRHRHAGDRGRRGDRHARLRQRAAELLGHAARLPARGRARRGRRDRRHAARAAARRAGLRGHARRDDEPHARGRGGLPAERAHRAPALRRRARPLGRSLRRAPALLVLLAAERGLRAALRAGHSARPRADRHLLREGLRRGRRRAGRRRDAGQARGSQLPHLPGRLRGQLPRARVLRPARARARGRRGADGS